jgi:hypothetical protein
MKFTFLCLVLSMAQCWAEQIPPWNEIQKTGRGGKLLKVAEAILRYERDTKSSPPTLVSLVTRGFLKEEDLCFRNKDGSLSVPDYFVKNGESPLSEVPVLKLEDEDHHYRIVVRWDLSVGGEEKK